MRLGVLRRAPTHSVLPHEAGYRSLVKAECAPDLFLRRAFLVHFGDDSFAIIVRHAVASPVGMCAHFVTSSSSRLMPLTSNHAPSSESYQPSHTGSSRACGM